MSDTFVREGAGSTSGVEGAYGTGGILYSHAVLTAAETPPCAADIICNLMACIENIISLMSGCLLRARVG